MISTQPRAPPRPKSRALSARRSVPAPRALKLRRLGKVKAAVLQKTGAARATRATRQIVQQQFQPARAPPRPRPSTGGRPGAPPTIPRRAGRSRNLLKKARRPAPQPRRRVSGCPSLCHSPHPLMLGARARQRPATPPPPQSPGGKPTPRESRTRRVATRSARDPGLDEAGHGREARRGPP